MVSIGRLFASAALAACVVMPVTAAAAQSRANDYNLFVLGDMTGKWSDTEGSVAIGGAADLKGYSVGALPRGGNTNLVVGGNATIDGGSTDGTIAVGGNASFKSYGIGAKLSAADTSLQVGGNLAVDGGSTKGKLIVGGTSSFVNFGPAPAVTTAANSVPINFAAEGLRLKTLATTMAGYTANGTVAVANGGGMLTLTGTDAALNVFNLTTAQAAAFNTFKLNITPGSIALINITGTAASMQNAGFTINGGAFGDADYSRVLFNFHNATSLTFDGIDVSGSVLAPNAAYAGGWGGVINGQMFVASWASPKGTTQVNSRWFAGRLLDPPSTVTAVPEPATWAMLALGFGLVGAMARRRRSVPQAA